MGLPSRFNSNHSMIAIIPARGGSKGLPSKNIIPLKGKPLIAYTIEAALEAANVSDVYVSTDDERIAIVAKEYGAKCPVERPEHLATDEALIADTLVHFLQELKAQTGQEVDEFVLLQPTSPLRRPDDIDKAITMFKERSADSVISCVEDHYPLEWRRRVALDGRFEDVLGHKETNRQAFEKTYTPNGAIYVMKALLLNRATYYTDNSYAFIMPASRSVDIDGEEDLALAEFYLDRLKRNPSNARNKDSL